MQQNKQHRQARRRVTSGAAAVALIALAALLATLALAGTGSSVYAAPHDGAPTLTITSITGNTVALEGDGWASQETITLSYSASSSCLPPTNLPTSSYALSWGGSNFQATITWPPGVARGAYYLCASGSITQVTIVTHQPITIDTSGNVQPTPGSTTTPNATTTSKTPTPTSTPGHNPGSTATRSGTTGTDGNGGDTNPGSKGASASAPVSSLVAIILLCLFVLALLVYLIRIWLQGRQAGGPTP